MAESSNAPRVPMPDEGPPQIPIKHIKEDCEEIVWAVMPSLIAIKKSKSNGAYTFIFHSDVRVTVHKVDKSGAAVRDWMQWDAMLSGVEADHNRAITEITKAYAQAKLDEDDNKAHAVKRPAPGGPKIEEMEP